MVTPFLSKSDNMYVKTIENNFHGNAGICGSKFTKSDRA
jgi:hypothetical protein